MSIGMKRKVDNVGRINIPKRYRTFYHFEENEEVCLIDTPDGVLITKPKYKMVKIDEKIYKEEN